MEIRPLETATRRTETAFGPSYALALEFARLADWSGTLEERGDAFSGELVARAYLRWHDQLNALRARSGLAPLAHDPSWLEYLDPRRRIPSWERANTQRREGLNTLMRQAALLRELVPVARAAVELTDPQFAVCLKTPDDWRLAFHSELCRQGLVPPNAYFDTIDVPQAARGPARRPARIAIADDDFGELVKTIDAVLGLPGATVVPILQPRQKHEQDREKEEAASGLEAVISALLAAEPDIVLMDLGFQGFSGREVIMRACERRPQLKRVPFVANTGGSPNGFANPAVVLVDGNCDKGRVLGPVREALARIHAL